MYDWNNYFYQLQQASQQQQQQIQELQQRMSELERVIQEKNSHMVDKVEYHFDQLKIERLDGTLHIGLSPNDLANIDDLGFGNQIPLDMNTNQQQANPNSTHHQVMADLTNFLRNEGPKMIQDLAQSHNRSIDGNYQSLLIQDMERQLPHRIAYYTNEASNQHFSTEDELHSYLYEQVKKEIYHSLTKYMQGNNEKGAEL
ncbi:spore germination protein PC [Oceanobacillus limi]|uniref:Spore germination protein PC n=1 Tax=Oceanobacillus limi TaxID=930131 RepID=A0A1I0C3Q5_9BACI|nr:spore germination protein GerPC [Oceanobacillus limi]SET14096.1 spore germination protein PC [Oceanobacillus limi]